MLVSGETASEADLERAEAYVEEVAACAVALDSCDESDKTTWLINATDCIRFNLGYVGP